MRRDVRTLQVISEGDAMELKGLYDAVVSLGLPSALAVFLVWHFVRLNHLLSRHNSQLVDELAKLRESVAKNPTLDTYHARIQQANEHVMTMMKEKEEQTHKLIAQKDEQTFRLIGQVMELKLSGDVGDKNGPANESH